SSSASAPVDHPVLLSFPTRRSSDLAPGEPARAGSSAGGRRRLRPAPPHAPRPQELEPRRPGVLRPLRRRPGGARPCLPPGNHLRSEEHTSELQSHLNLVCRLLLEKK